jgi:F-type H+-transporting ATPase subunit delta
LKNADPQVLRTYAKSLLSGDTEIISHALTILQQFLSEEQVRSLMFNPTVPKKEKLEVFLAIIKKEKCYSETIERFLHGVLEKRREKILLSLPSVYEHLLEEGKKGTIALITTPEKLSDDQRDFIVKKLSRYLQEKGYPVPISFNYSLDPTLIGGLKVFIDDFILDLSLQNQLKKAEQFLISEKR